MKLLLLLFLFLSSTLGARTYYYAPAIVGGVVATSGLMAERTLYNSLMRSELKGWGRPETASSVRLEAQCGIEAEFHLVGNHRQNFLLLAVTNRNEEALAVQYKEIKFFLDDHKVRYPGYLHHPSDGHIRSGWWMANWVPFPKKEEFQNVKKIAVEVPVKMEKANEVCIVRTAFEKEREIPSESRSFSAFEFLFDGGGALGQSGNTERLGKPSGIVAVEFNFFPKAHSGFGLVFSNETGFKDSKKPKIHQKFEKVEDYTAHLSYLGFNYLYRRFFYRDFFLQYSIGAGYQSVEDTDEDEVNNVKARGLGLSQKIMFNWRMKQWLLPSYETMDFFTGIGVVHYYSPGMNIGGEELDGHRVGGLFRIGISF